MWFALHKILDYLRLGIVFSKMLVWLFLWIMFLEEKHVGVRMYVCVFVYEQKYSDIFVAKDVK